MISKKIPKSAKYSKRDVAYGTKVEMEHTKDRKTARGIAIQHLNEHVTYYRVLPAAESVMTMMEHKHPPAPKRRKRQARPANLNTWVPKIQIPRF